MNHKAQMKFLTLKRQCITYRAIQKTRFIKENFENFEVSHRVLLQ